MKFAVIVSQSNGKWVFCKHKERDAYEVPGGHREAGESILETAKRELQEETGAIRFDMKPLCVYSVTGKTRVNDTGEESFGLLCYTDTASQSGKQGAGASGTPNRDARGDLRQMFITGGHG